MKAWRRLSSVHTQRGPSTSEHLFRVHVYTSTGTFARPHVCRVMQSQKKVIFQWFSADCRAAGEGKMRGWQQRREGTKEGSKVRESVAFRDWNSGVCGRGLQGGCVSTGGGHWLKYDLALFHLEAVMNSLDTQTHRHTRRVSTKKVLDNKGTSWHITCTYTCLYTNTAPSHDVHVSSAVTNSHAEKTSATKTFLPVCSENTKLLLVFSQLITYVTVAQTFLQF